MITKGISINLSSKVMESNHFKMVISIEVIMRLASLMEKANILGQVEPTIKVNFIKE